MNLMYISLFTNLIPLQNEMSYKTFLKSCSKVLQKQMENVMFVLCMKFTYTKIQNLGIIL